ncbi:MAG: hypothetical protein WA814_06285 [Candidatus Baltobacteraceae bacterium]
MSKLMVLASEASFEVHEGIIYAQAPAQVQEAAAALSSPLRALNHEQSGSLVFMASLIAPAQVIVRVSWSGYKDGTADGTIIMPSDTDAHVGTQSGEPFVIGPGEVEEVGGADTSHIALVETPENPKLFEGVALVGENAPCDAQVAAGEG